MDEQWKNIIVATRGMVLNGATDLEIINQFEDPGTQLKIMNLIREVRFELNIYRNES